MRSSRPIFALVVLAAGCNSKCSACEDQPPVVVETVDAEVPAPEPQVIRERPALIAAPPDVGAPPADAQTTASGLAYKVIVAGTGTVHPARKDTVTVRQTGWTKSGFMIDSSVSRGQPTTF